MKVKHLKEVDMRIDEHERHVMMTEGFKKYCEEMIEKATAYDMSRAADDQHVLDVESFYISGEGGQIFFKNSKNL